MKLLATGGAGFIGSNFIQYMLKKYKDIKIVNYDKLTYAGNLKNTETFKDDPRYTFIKGDICDYKKLKSVLSDCDAIINFAAETHVDRSLTDSSSFLKTNVEGVRVILDLVNELKIKKYIQIGTDEVYGDTEGKPRSNPTDKLLPMNPYSVSKAAGDLLCLSYCHTYKTPVIITRSTNNYGPNQHREKMIPTIITSILQDEEIPVYGDGLQRRDWLYVLDNCRAIDKVLNKGKIGGIYHIGYCHKKEITNLDVIEQIGKVMDRTPKIKYVTDRLGHDRRYCLNTLTTKELGWKPLFDLKMGLTETFNWYLQNL